MPATAEARARMVERQLARRGIANPMVLSAMREVPREEFVPAGQREFAYEDSPLSIQAGQTISQPYIVARMIEAAGLAAGDRVLEIGAGSGYAAAVMSRIAAQVHAIERHEELTGLARERLRRLGYGNVTLRTGDGTRGWDDAAPFDAILSAAAGPAIPQALKEQLDIGGRLVMPVGTQREQRLVKVTRRDARHFEEEDLGSVLFVPLIGEHGWKTDERGTEGAGAAPERTIPKLIAAAAEPLPDPEDPAFGAAIDRFAGARVVLLGEASHGTSEFYRARAAITQRLIERHGFTILALDADWPDAASLDRHVRCKPGTDAEPPFARFPTWMWRNAEVEAFTTWLRGWWSVRVAELGAAVLIADDGGRPRGAEAAAAPAGIGDRPVVARRGPGARPVAYMARGVDLGAMDDKQPYDREAMACRRAFSALSSGVD